jgi:signal transduction histidine kinase
LTMLRQGVGAQAPEITAKIQAIEAIRQKEDVDYILKDISNLVAESSDGTRRVMEIVQSLKSFARIDEATVMEADVNECIETTLRVVWNELKYKCEIRKNFGSLPRIRCYPGQLNQVFMNLLVNAAYAIETHGIISIETSSTPTQIVVQIADTGKGISPEHMPKLFTPFFTTKPVGKGTGLGLPISYGIIQKHQGIIEVKSEIGQGTAFTIRLPLAGVPAS